MTKPQRAMLLSGPQYSPEATRAPVNRCGVFVDVAKMLSEYWKEWQTYSMHDQLCLAVPDPTMLDEMAHKNQLTVGTGRLHEGPWKDREFTHLVRGVEFIKILFDYAWSFGYRPTRPMLRYLPAKQCLSYHKDDVAIRFHLVIDTHAEAFFVVKDLVYRMPEVGALYTLRTDEMHTAVNAHLTKPRLHFTFSGYKDNS